MVAISQGGLSSYLEVHFADPTLDPFNKAMFAFASYNAGPTRIAELREKAKKRGLDPNEWFNNVELVAAREIGRETVQYVSNILKYYVVYCRLQEQQQKREEIIRMNGGPGENAPPP